MIGFVVPFRPKQNSKNWENDSHLLHLTLKSICNQSSSDFKVYVIYHDLPEDIYNHQNLTYVEFPYKFCELDDLTGKSHQQTIDKVMSVNAFDQGKKALYGAHFAIKEDCEYIMSVDSDDLISNKIAAYVNSQPKCDGWYIDKGYIYLEQKKLLMRKSSKMNSINGSTNIIHAQNIPYVDFNSRQVDLFSFFAAHGYLLERLKNLGKVLKPLPFYGVIYVSHISNWSQVNNSFDGNSLKKILLKFIRYQPKYSHIKRTFNL